MPVLNDLFLHEYLGNTENRVNVALFALMQQHWFRRWFVERLGLPLDAIVYPPTQRKARRPDLKVVDTDGDLLALVEVELDKDTSQADDYRRRFGPDTIKTVWGTPAHGGDLSLKEIAGQLKGQRGLHPQVAANVQQLVQLIEEGLQGRSTAPGRGELSREMRDHDLVVRLCDLLGNRIRFDLAGNRPPPPGYLKADTTATDNNLGLSLRVYSPKPANKTVSIMSMSGGRETVYFPSLPMLEAQLSPCREAIAAYRAALCDMQLDIGKFAIRERPRLPLGTVLEHLDRLAMPTLRILPTRSGFSGRSSYVVVRYCNPLTSITFCLGIRLAQEPRSVQALGPERPVE